ncbi:MAG: helix-turn-helix domain-containing protein [Bryobacteraceae bacterium]|jgi:excisionase family DNA binding protein
MIQPANIDLESLLDALAERVAEKLKPSMPGAVSRQAAPRLFTVDQAASYLGRTKASVQHMVSAGRLPIVRADRRVFLDVRNLDAWIEQNKEAGTG